MMILAKAVAVVLAAGACATGMAVAATPAFASTASSDETVLVYRAELKGLQSVSLPDYQCPADHAWLKDANLAPGRIVPPGVSVDEPGSIGVTIQHAHNGTGNLAVGWNSDESSATNWDVNSHLLSISATCTNDPDQAYSAGD
jgi:hypothetical protein